MEKFHFMLNIIPKDIALAVNFGELYYGDGPRKRLLCLGCSS